MAISVEVVIAGFLGIVVVSLLGLSLRPLYTKRRLLIETGQYHRVDSLSDVAAYDLTEIDNMDVIKADVDVLPDDITEDGSLADGGFALGSSSIGFSHDFAIGYGSRATGGENHGDR